MLAVSRIGPDMILAAAMTVLLICGVLKPVEALSGFGNAGVLIGRGAVRHGGRQG